MLRFWLECLLRREEPLFGNGLQRQDEWDWFLEQLVQSPCGEALIAPLLSGNMELQYNRHLDNYRLFYEFSVGPTAVYWMLEPRFGLTTRLSEPNISSWSAPSLVQVWSSTWTTEFRQQIEALFSGASTEVPTIAWDWSAVVDWLQRKCGPRW